jgi:hypothetical protein
MCGLVVTVTKSVHGVQAMEVGATADVGATSDVVITSLVGATELVDVVVEEGQV